MTLGEQIKQAREQKHLSQEELAEQLGVSRQAVSKWENDSSMSQGINRELLSQILDLNLVPKEEVKNNKIISWAGWVVSIILLMILTALIIIYTKNDKTSKELQQNASTERQNEEPTIKNIRFYDSDMNEVLDEALWYNAAQIESILISWEGTPPNSIKIFATPSGTETLEKTKLLLTKQILDGDNVELINADVLKTLVQDHVVFVLDYGENMVSSDMYNIFYYTEDTDEEMTISEMMDRFCAEQGLENAVDYAVGIEEYMLVRLCVSESGKYEAYGLISPQYGKKGILINNIIDGEYNTNYFEEETWTYASGQPKFEEISDYEVIFTFWKEEDDFDIIRSIYFDTYDTGTMEPRN